ncbi:hypothetical protein QQX98_009755 [Neonectria punicea]|uniref:Ryanodine receptor Ryr domain-containing protein n=1 Tax=Neonectria punicea TaxID=979145 RepID=A0ABR1GRT8_9HYPO
MAAISSSLKHIIIAGDAPILLFLYPPTKKFNPNSRHDHGARAHWFHVGADLLGQLLDAGLNDPKHQVDVYKPSLESPEKNKIQSIVELDAHEPINRGSQDPKTFRLRRIQQIDTARTWHFPSLEGSVHDPSGLSIVVFQETKIENPVPEDNSTNAIALFKKCRPRFLVYHMARPLCRGKIWETVRHGPLLDTDKPDLERLIVIVDADDLRAEGIDPSYGLSWEKTCENFVERLGLVGKLVSLATPLGAAVFIFGAAAARTYKELRKKATKSKPDGHLTREQEVVACLHGFANILGPNKVQYGEKMDRMYPVRRAVILRSLIEKREPNLKYRDKIHIDDGVLNALLLVPTYRQGIKSLASIIGMSRLNGYYQFERSALPPPAQLDVHVDYKTFTIYLNSMPLPKHLREDLAEKLHNTYNDERRKTANDAEKKKLTQWNDTDEELRESSRAHADAIPSKLRIIGCYLSETQEYRKPVESFTRDQIEKIAEVQHERWNAEKLQNQWGKGKERDIKARKSPFLVPWVDLPEQWKDIGRGMAKSYPKILPVSHKIYEMGPRGITV